VFVQLRNAEIFSLPVGVASKSFQYPSRTYLADAKNKLSEAEVLDVSVTEATRYAIIKPAVSVAPAEPAAVLDFDILDTGDGFRVQVVYAIAFLSAEAFPNWYASIPNGLKVWAGRASDYVAGLMVLALVVAVFSTSALRFAEEAAPTGVVLGESHRFVIDQK